MSFLAGVLASLLEKLLAAFVALTEKLIEQKKAQASKEAESVQDAKHAEGAVSDDQRAGALEDISRHTFK